MKIKYYALMMCAMSPITALANTPTISQIVTGLNPSVSVILDGRYTDADSSELVLPGFILGGEAELSEEGFSTGHNEFNIRANVDDKLVGVLNTAIVNEDGETELELEEAFIETLGLGKGVSLKAGKFYSNIGYLNSIHDHAHDFADRALVYDALLGGHLGDTGIQARWVAPTDTYLTFGTEVTSGSQYPGGENDGNNNGLALFAKTGGDIGDSSSWQVGASYYQTEFDEREAGAHGHGGEESDADHHIANGKVNIRGFDAVYKWAPRGNNRVVNFKLQAEYFQRNESGESEFVEGANSATANYNGDQSGFYTQAIYQFRPSWRVGVRYDQITADNSISNFVDSGVDRDEFLEESSIGDGKQKHKRSTIMVDYSPSHFTRLRLQYGKLDVENSEDNDVITLQYIVGLGEHGAHTF